MPKIKKAFAKKLLFIAAEIIIIFDFIVWPLVKPVYAENKLTENNLINFNQSAPTKQKIAKPKQKNSSISQKTITKLPKAKILQPKFTKYSVLTAYSSESSQCDSSPCITASGFNVCQHQKEDTIAANFLPLGAKVRIPKYFGNKIFIVRDRMNPRYYNRVDIWMSKREKAIKFGVKKAIIEVLAY